MALTNAIAVSPTDTMPLTRRAKGLMAVESLISYAVVILVVSRAVNILGGLRPGACGRALSTCSCTTQPDGTTIAAPPSMSSSPCSWAGSDPRPRSRLR